MNKKNNKLSLVLFGYDRHEVDFELERIKSKNDKAINQIKSELEKAQEENKLLINEHNDLKKEIEHELYEEIESKDFMSYALKKVEEYIPLINNAANEEISKIKTVSADSEMMLNKKIEEFDNQIKETQVKLTKLLSEIIKSNENIDKNLSEFIEERYSNIKFETPKIKHKQNNTIVKVEPKVEIKESREHKETKNIHKDHLVKTSNSLEISDDDTKDFKKEKYHQEAENSSGGNKFLIGKVAGDNLLDEKGNVIISKGTTITEDVIKKSEDFGKLTELIINMTIPNVYK